MRLELNVSVLLRGDGKGKRHYLRLFRFLLSECFATRNRSAILVFKPTGVEDTHQILAAFSF